MRSLTSSFRRAFSLFVIAAIASGGCAGGRSSVGVKSHVLDEKYRIAVLPIENLSGAPAPFKDLRDSMMQKIKQLGIALLGEEELERFMEKQRVRYIGGLEGPTAAAFKAEADTDAVLITSLERYDETFPPKISLLCRLVSTGEHPSVLWTDRVGLSGDDSPGILGLGIVENPHVLVEKALSRLTDALAGYLSTAAGRGEGAGSAFASGNLYQSYKVSGRGTFRPKAEYRSIVIHPERTYRVAVLPFQNLSMRKNAGEIVALHFIGQLSKRANISVVEPGVIRQEMLAKRIIMSAGVSLADVDLLSDYPEVDLIVSGTVFSYQDSTGYSGTPKVDFSAQVIDRKSKEVVWVSESRNEGDDGVMFFDLGRLNTENAMASEMVGITVGQMMSEQN